MLDEWDPELRLNSGRREFGEYGGVNASIEVSTTFTVMHASTLPAIFAGERGPDKGCYVYGRSFNPTVRNLGRQIAALEGLETGYGCSSGMAAISATMLMLCNAGDHIVASHTIYGGTYAFFKSFLPTKCNIDVTFVNILDLDAVQKAIGSRTKVLYTETVSNPTLTVADLPSLSAIAHAAGLKLVVDNTFTPCIMSPARWGADVVIHSATKFISGASDIVAGLVAGPKHLIGALMDFNYGPLMLLGPTLDPKIASELRLRLPHLPLRMREHSRRALAMAQGLEELGAKVQYPGLSSHPQHQLMQKLVNPGYGFGGVLGVDLGSPRRAEIFMERLQNKHSFGLMAVSLGYFDTLMSLSAASTSSELSDDALDASGIGRGYVRLSIGITGSMEKRWEALRETWEFVQRVGDVAPYRAVRLKLSTDSAPVPLESWPSEGIEEDASHEEVLDLSAVWRIPKVPSSSTMQRQQSRTTELPPRSPLPADALGIPVAVEPTPVLGSRSKELEITHQVRQPATVAMLTSSPLSLACGGAGNAGEVIVLQPPFDDEPLLLYPPLAMTRVSAEEGVVYVSTGAPQLVSRKRNRQDSEKTESPSHESECVMDTHIDLALGQST